MMFKTVLGWTLVAIGAVLGGVAIIKAVRSTLPSVDNIDIAAAPRKQFPVKLIGVDYMATAPKKALALSLMMRVRRAGDNPELMSDAIDSLIIKMLGRDHIELIKARLEDEDDDLDIDHLMTLMNKLIEATSPDPTT